MTILSPSILSADFKNLEKDIKAIDEAGAEYIHIDVMDGRFVPSISYGMPVIKSIRSCTSRVFDVHLMIEEPIRYIEEFVKCGADIITVHVEACEDVVATIEKIRECGVKAAITLNPETPVKAIEPYLSLVDMVLVMSVHPGFGGQKFIPESLEKVKQIKAKLIEKIAELVRDKKIDGITDLRDESDREGMRIAIELRRDVNPNIILNQLYKHTQLQDTFGVIMLALVDNQPKVLNLYDMLKYYLLHQEEVVTRRTKFDLNKAEERAHILEGLMIALDNIDRVISIIRGSANVQIAKESLIAEFALSEAQAQAIVDMRLRALTGLERSKLEAELKELHEKIKEYKAILADKKLLLGVIKTEISEIADKYGDDRRTSIGYDEYDISMEDLIPDEPCVIARTNLGYVKRMTPDNFKSQHRGGKGIKGMQTIDDDYIKDLFMTTSHHVLTFFTNTGRAYKLKAYEIPQASRTSRGTAIINLLQLAPGETITAVVPVKIDTLQDTDYLFMATKKGIVKKTPVKEFANIRKTGIQAINLREDDELIEVKLTDDQAEILMVTMLGQCIRFKETDVRPTGRSAMGVIGMSLMDEDEVVGVQVSTQGDTMLIVSENGMGKRTDIDEYTVQHRGGKGVKCYKITEKTGNVVGAKAVDDSREVMLITTEGIIIRLQCSDISNLGRITSGVKLINLDEGIKVATIAKVRKQPADEDGKDAEGFEEDTNKTVEFEE